MRGSIHAYSMGQYFAAISKAHVHCGMRAPVVQDVDGIISSTIKGLSKLQKQVYAEDQVLYLPAPYVSKILDTTVFFGTDVSAIILLLDTPGGGPAWRRLTDGQRGACDNFRDGLMLVFNFCDFGRADTQARMSARDVGVDDNGYHNGRPMITKSRDFPPALCKRTRRQEDKLDVSMAVYLGF